MNIWNLLDRETQLNLQEIAHKKLVLLGQSDAIKIVAKEKKRSISNKVNPICKEMLHILKQELEHNEEIIINKSRLAELSFCDN